MKAFALQVVENDLDYLRLTELRLAGMLATAQRGDINSLVELLGQARGYVSCVKGDLEKQQARLQLEEKQREEQRRDYLQASTKDRALMASEEETNEVVIMHMHLAESELA